MTCNDVLGKPSWQRMRCQSLTMEHRVVIVLRAFVVLVPPLSQRRHVVAGYGTYRTVRVLAEVSETCCCCLGHALQLKAEYFQFVHHPWHAIGHHAKVFGTHEHTGCLHELGQLLHCLTIPELVVATIVIIVVKAVEGLLVVVVERLVNEVELG